MVPRSGQHQPPTHRVARRRVGNLGPSAASGLSSRQESALRPRGSGGAEPAGSYEDGSKMTSKRKPFQTQLRRSISEQLRDSTTRAWDLLWKNVRERRLAGRCPRLRTRGGGRKRNPVACSRPQCSRRFTPPPATLTGFRAWGWVEQAVRTPSPVPRSVRPPHALRVWALPDAGTDSLAGLCARGWEPGRGAQESFAERGRFLWVGCCFVASRLSPLTD